MPVSERTFVGRRGTPVLTGGLSGEPAGLVGTRPWNEARSQVRSLDAAAARVPDAAGAGSWRRELTDSRKLPEMLLKVVLVLWDLRTQPSGL